MRLATGHALPNHHLPDMNRPYHSPYILIYSCVILMTLIPISCGTLTPHYDFRELARASIRLNMDIDRSDNQRLYLESARWIGTPYLTGGNGHKGIDCSGLTGSIYRKVYGKHLNRNSDEQRRLNCRKIARHKLREGDLVFFHDGKHRRVASHVGIYLKNNRFIHASTSRGVIVSSLNEPYYRKTWMQAGRVKGIH